MKALKSQFVVPPNFIRSLRLIAILRIQPEKIVALTDAANVEVEPIWASLLAKALEGKNVKDLLSNVGSGGGAPAAGAAPAAAGGAAAAVEEKKEEAKEEEKEESDDDMVCQNFALRIIVSNTFLFSHRASVSSIKRFLHLYLRFYASPSPPPLYVTACTFTPARTPKSTRNLLIV